MNQLFDTPAIGWVRALLSRCCSYFFAPFLTYKNRFNGVPFHCKFAVHKSELYFINHQSSNMTAAVASYTPQERFFGNDLTNYEFKTVVSSRKLKSVNINPTPKVNMTCF